MFTFSEPRTKRKSPSSATTLSHPSRQINRLLSILVVSLSLQTQATGQVTSDSSAVADSLLILELEREMGGLGTPVEAKANPRPQSAASANPNISVIGDFRAWYDSEAEREVDAELHEVEIAFRSVVDPYARADFYVAAGHNGEGEFEFEMEEAYLTTLSLPYQLQARVGKYRSVFGKLNRKHPHALPFIDSPAIYLNYLGDEGLNDQGLSLSWLIPNGRFFQDITVEATRGPGESESFERSESGKFLYAAHLKNFFDLDANSTLELGFSGAAGPNAEGETTFLGGVDLTYIWKPLRFNTYRSIMLQAESFHSRMNTELGESVDSWGFFVLGSYQLARRWFVTGRYDHSDLPDNPNWNEDVFSGTLRWNATEFQKLELGLRTSEAQGVPRNTQLLFRAVFVIGVHGAHEY